MSNVNEMEKPFVYLDVTSMSFSEAFSILDRNNINTKYNLVVINYPSNNLSLQDLNYIKIHDINLIQIENYSMTYNTDTYDIVLLFEACKDIMRSVPRILLTNSSSLKDKYITQLNCLYSNSSIHLVNDDKGNICTYFDYYKNTFTDLTKVVKSIFEYRKLNARQISIICTLLHNLGLQDYIPASVGNYVYFTQMPNTYVIDVLVEFKDSDIFPNLLSAIRRNKGTALKYNSLFNSALCNIKRVYPIEF